MFNPPPKADKAKYKPDGGINTRKNAVRHHGEIRAEWKTSQLRHKVLYLHHKYAKRNPNIVYCTWQAFSAQTNISRNTVGSGKTCDYEVV